MEIKNNAFRVFLDVRTSQKINSNDRLQNICFAGVSPTGSFDFRKLKPYEHVPSAEKAMEARRIKTYMQNGSLRFSWIAVTGRSTNHWAKMAFETLSRCKDIVGYELLKDPATGKLSIKYRNSNFTAPLANTLSLYANILVFFALGFSRMDVNSNVRHLRFIFDRPPGAPETSMEFLRELTNSDPDILDTWNELAAGWTFDIENLSTSQTPQGKNPAANKHKQHLHLADWLTASCLANVHPTQLEEVGAKLDDNDVEEIASIIRQAETLNMGKIINLDTIL